MATEGGEETAGQDSRGPHRLWLPTPCDLTHVCPGTRNWPPSSWGPCRSRSGCGSCSAVGRISWWRYGAQSWTKALLHAVAGNGLSTISEKGLLRFEYKISHAL